MTDDTPDWVAQDIESDAPFRPVTRGDLGHLGGNARDNEIHSSDGIVEGHEPEGSASVAVRGLRERRPRDMEAAGSQREAETGWSPEMARVRERASNCTSQDSDRVAGPSAARSRAGVESCPSELISTGNARFRAPEPDRAQQILQGQRPTAKRTAVYPWWWL
jgi:hypothetical protein